MPKHHRIIAMLLASSALAPVVGMAQDVAPGTPEAATETAQGAADAAQDASATPAPPADEIVVTGSRIVRPEFAAPNPIVSFNAADIQQSGDTNVTQFLQRVPALTNSRDSTRTSGLSQTDGRFGEAGLNLLDLRGLGPERTLVLVNGRRHVAGQVNTAAVDINSIPTDLIERVDVLTGGASAVYGADGVSGVVNFVLKRDFEGVSARSQFGISQRGDAANRFASIAAGHNFADNRGNVTIAYEYNADQPLGNDDRAYLRQENRSYLVNQDNYDPTKPGSFQLGSVRDLRYPYGSNQGYVVVGDTVFRGDGALYTPGRFLVNDGFSTGGDDTPVAGYAGDLLPRTRRNAVNVLGHYDFSDAFKLSVEGKFVQVNTRTFSGYGGDYPATISLENPFVPASIRAAALAAGLTSVDVSRNNFDIGRRGEADRRRTWRGVIDASGRISDHARYDLYYTYGETDVRITRLNDRLADQFTQALDVVTDPLTGRAVCRSRAAGCIPVNLFGGTTVDPASQAFYIFNHDSFASIKQHVVSGSVSGDFGALFSLPGGPIEFAFGGEYRRESSRFQPNAALLETSPGSGVNRFYQYDEYIIPTPSSGHFDVGEAFGELNLPILKDVPGASLLSVGAAGRYSHYSTIGSTEAYQFNAVYAPVRDVSFRGSYSRSVRAPNIGELFQPQTGTSAFFSDPCYLTNRGSGTQYRAANCTALVTAAGGNNATFTAANNINATIFIPGTQQGNPNLDAEVARTWTAGVVLRPRFVPGLQISADWYDIRLRNAINTPEATKVAELCVDQPTTDNAFCRSISRMTGSGYIDGFVNQPQNVASFRTAGLDVAADYRITAGHLGRFDIHFVGGYLDKLNQIATPGANTEDNRDQPYRPKFNFTFSPTWTLGGLVLTYNLRWQDGTRRIARIITDNNPSYIDPRLFRYKELWEHDVQLQYQLPEGITVYGGVNNLGDQKPDTLGPSIDVNRPISPIGRFLYVGAKLRFGAS